MTEKGIDWAVKTVISLQQSSKEKCQNQKNVDNRVATHVQDVQMHKMLRGDNS